MPYLATHFQKCIQKDDFNEGASGLHTIVQDHRIDIRAESIKQLIEKCCEYAEIKVPPSVFTDEDNPIFFSVDRQETRDGRTLGPKKQEQWKAGEIEAYIADYRFQINFTRETTMSDFSESGVETH